MAKLKVGNPIYYVKYTRGKGYSELKCTLIHSVGTKYFTTNLGVYDKVSYAYPLTGAKSDNHYYYFFSKAEYEIWAKKNELLTEIRNIGVSSATFYEKLERMSNTDIETILNIFKNYE